MPEFRNATLSNGLRIAAEIDSRSYSAAYGYFVRSGSRNEVDSESGLSHFLEHMMFKGTKRRTAAMVNRELDELGGQSNAYTTEEQTVYYATVLPKFQDRILDLLTDMLSPVLDEGEFETERQVILEEIAKYEDQPPFGAFERAMELHFTPRGLGRRVLGTADSVREMSAQSMRRYFDRRYHPSNIVLAATGDVNFDEMVAFVESATAAWADRNTDDVPAPDDLSQLPVGIALDTALDIEDASQRIQLALAKAQRSAVRIATMPESWQRSWVTRVVAVCFGIWLIQAKQSWQPFGHKSLPTKGLGSPTWSVALTISSRIWNRSKRSFKILRLTVSKKVSLSKRSTRLLLVASCRAIGRAIVCSESVAAG